MPTIRPKTIATRPPRNNATRKRAHSPSGPARADSPIASNQFSTDRPKVKGVISERAEEAIRSRASAGRISNAVT